MWSNIAFGIVLVAVASLLTIIQVRAARRLPTDPSEANEHETNYLRARYRRHAMTNSLIALTGVAIIGASWMRSSEATLFYWGLVMLLVSAIVYSALVDVGATRVYYGQLRREQVRDREALQAELRQFHVEKANGESAEEEDC